MTSQVVYTFKVPIVFSKVCLKVHFLNTTFPNKNATTSPVFMALNRQKKAAIANSITR